MSEKIIYIPKPEWWDWRDVDFKEQNKYLEALEATSKALGVIIKLED